MTSKSKSKPPDQNLEAFLEEAYGLDGLADALSFYGQWAEAYDDQMEQGLHYIAPDEMARILAEHLEDRSARILDIGCGTGLTSQYLADRGFGNFDGIDITPEMLDRAKGRGIYRKLLQADITKPLDLPDATYDAAISTGTFTVGHIGSEPFHEIWRVLKPSALFGCSIHKKIWVPAGFEAKVAELESADSLRIVEITQGAFFSGRDESAMYCIFQKI